MIRLSSFTHRIILAVFWLFNLGPVLESVVGPLFSCQLPVLDSDARVPREFSLGNCHKGLASISSRYKTWSGISLRYKHQYSSNLSMD